MRTDHLAPLGVLALATTLAACGLFDDGPTEPEPDPLRITTSTLPAAVVGDPYSAGVDAEGGDEGYSWTLTAGSLPPGLQLSVDDLVDNDAFITGIPTQEGSFAFTLRVASADGQARTGSFTIAVLAEPPPLDITTPVLPPALIGAPYDTRLNPAGGDGSNYTFSLVGGTLPSGLTLTTTGRIHGTPTGADTTVIMVRVTSGSFEAEKTFTLQVVANRTGTFDVTVAPVVPIPAAVQAPLEAAIARWQEAITGDLPTGSIPVGFFSAGQCGGFGPILNGTSADDVIVLINITPIDGPGQTLGQAGPCVIRGNDMPFAGVLTLDADDLALMGAQATTDLIVHEIAHVLGFGSLWELMGLVTESESDPRFIGSAANTQWNALGGTGQVPVENQGGEGTAGSHWREAAFDEELMTGFAEPSGTQPLSRVSIASFTDMGYAVNLNAADPFSLAAPMGVSATLHDLVAARGWDVVLRETIRRIEDDGTVTLLHPEDR